MSVKKNIIANYAGQGWSALMGLAFTPVYISYMGMERYGLVGVFMVLQTCVTLLDVGMTPTINRDIARFTAGAHSPIAIRDLVRTFEVVAWGVAILACVAIVSSADWLSEHWLMVRTIPLREVRSSISLLGVVAVLTFVEGLYRGALLGFQQHGWLNLLSVIIATLRSGGAAVVLMLQSAPTAEAFFLWQAAVYLASIGLLFAALHRRLPHSAGRPQIRLQALSESWRFAGGMFVTGAFGLLLTQADKVVLARLLPLDVFGTYMLAVTAANALILVFVPISQSYYPRLCELAARNDTPALTGTYHEAAQLMASMLIPAGFTLLAFSYPLLFGWTGNHDISAAAAPIAAVLAVGTTIYGLLQVPHMLQLAYGWAMLTGYINALAAVVVLPTLFFVVPRFGAIGAAWVWVATNVTYLVVFVHLLHSRLLKEEKRRWYVRDVCCPLVVAGTVLLLARVAEPAECGLYCSALFAVTSCGVAIVAVAVVTPRMRAHLALAVHQLLRPRRGSDI